MRIVHQGIAPEAAAFAAAQRSASGSANLPSSVDIERLLRAESGAALRLGFGSSTSDATWREVSR